MSEGLEVTLGASAVPAGIHEPGRFEALRRWAIGVVEGKGIRGQDADGVCDAVLAKLRVGPLVSTGTTTLERALRHRLHLECLHFWRTQSRRRRLHDGLAARSRGRSGPNDGAPVTSMHHEEVRDAVRKALAGLGDADRKLLLLFHLAEIPMEQVQAQMGYASREVLHARLSQARRRLRDLMGQGGDPR